MCQSHSSIRVLTSPTYAKHPMSPASINVNTWYIRLINKQLVNLMSLISKLTSLFGSSQTTKGTQSPNDPRLEEVIRQIIRPSSKFNLKAASQSLTIFILEKDENLDLVFNFIQSPISLQTNQIQPTAVVQLLACLHRVFHNPDLQYDLALKIKETKLLWLQEYLDDKENIKTPSKKQSKDIDLDVPRRMETEAHEVNSQFQEQCLATEGAEERKFNHIQMSQYAQTYHTYLQRLAANVDLFRSVSSNLYPYMTAKDYVEPKLMFLWHYKIQNILNTALPLLHHFDTNISEIQKQLWGDLHMFQKFITNELQKVADAYATLPNSDTLSLYEIFSDTIKHSKVLDHFVNQAKGTFVLQPAPQVLIPQNILQDFLGFASRLKVLNQFTFKRSIKVPNKQNPCMGIPTHNPNLRHLRSTSGGNLVKLKEYNNDSFECLPVEEFEEPKRQDDSDPEELADKVFSQNSGGSNNLEQPQKYNKKKNVHIRGLSTFQQQ